MTSPAERPLSGPWFWPLVAILTLLPLLAASVYAQQQAHQRILFHRYAPGTDRPFDREAWMDIRRFNLPSECRGTMTASVLKLPLAGKTELQVRELLGAPDGNEDSTFSYALGKRDSLLFGPEEIILLLGFRNGVCTKVTMADH